MTHATSAFHHHTTFRHPTRGKTAYSKLSTDPMIPLVEIHKDSVVKRKMHSKEVRTFFG